MKKILSLVLALAMLLGCTSAMADITLTIDKPDANGNYPVFAGTDADYASYVVGDEIIRMFMDAPIDGAVAVGWEIYHLDMASQTRDAKPVAGEWWTADINTDNKAGKVNNIMDYTIDGSEETYEAVVTWEYVNADGETVRFEESEKFYVNAVDMNKTILSAEAWYPNNHAHAFGPKLADSWKTYSVVDLSKDGTTALKLVAAGAWEIGTVFVTVKGDAAVVDYRMHEDIKTTDVHNDITVDSEYLNIFADAASIDPKAESTFAFGVPFSIANDLGGATVVALYTELTVDVPTHSPFVYRFWPNLKANWNIVKAMNDLLGAETAPALYNGKVPAEIVPSPNPDKVPSPVPSPAA